MITTRFAPSPTGPLHLGHAYSAIFAHDLARRAGGRFLLRVEDIDRSRCRPEWEARIVEDLHWLGLRWDGPVLRQSDRLNNYHAALDRLWAAGLLFACDCKRRDILDAVSAPQEGSAAVGPDGIVYPGTCRAKGLARDSGALRLDMARALATLGDDALSWHEDGESLPIARDDLLRGVGDVVLARRDMGTSYHLSVVLDDADQGISHVTRGEDLREATQIHVVLHYLLGLPSPEYLHHRLIRDDTGKRLAKRDDARAIARYRDDGLGPADIRAMVGLS